MVAPVGGPARHDPPPECDLAVVGGGLVGLAVARELARRHPRLSISLLERERTLAAHQSGHSSGVIHAGIYYRPGSLKARLCVEGARELYEYCEARSIAHERCGKVILAIAPEELPRLEELHRRGLANGVRDLHLLDAAGLHRIEPHARALAALHSPHTGIVDFGSVAAALAQDLREAGARIATACEVSSVNAARRSLRLRVPGGEVAAGAAVFCAGAWADRLALSAGAAVDPRIVPFRGAYLRLAPAARRLVRSLIYPVPDPALPFLGVHLSRHLDGDVLVGPTALLAGARDGYRAGALRLRDVLETLSWPGAWTMAARWWATGASELLHALSARTLMAAATRYVPELRGLRAQFAFAGVRAQAVTHAGELLDDFHFSFSPRALHVRNAPSPAATAIFAIARHVADLADRTFDM